MALYIDAGAISLAKALSKKIGKGCAPAAEAMWSEMKRNYVSSENFKDIWFN